jgi:ABC-type branched-subunit amino acid transport system substrate-binding protein
MVNAIFVDAFWPQSQDEAMLTFTQKYQETFNKQPNLFDAIAYDSILISNQIFLQAQGSRDSVRNTLEKGSFTGSVTGIHQFTTTHELDRDFHILVVKPSKIEEWTPTSTPPK